MSNDLIYKIKYQGYTDMELKNRTLSNFADLVQTGECKKFKGRLKVGVDLGTANTVLAVVDTTNRPIAGISAPSQAIRDGVIVNYYESVQLVTRLKAELEEKLKTELPYAAAAIPPGVSEGSSKVFNMCWRVQVLRFPIS